MESTHTQHPNLIFVVPDEFRPVSLGFLGQEPVLTPNIDSFANESVYLPNAVSNYPVCTPYRGMLFTGQYPLRSGIVENCRSVSPPSCHWDPEQRCLTDILKDAGYDLGYIGKLHLDIPTDADAKYGEGPRGDGVVWDAYTPPERRHGINFWHSYGCCDNHLNPHYWIGDAPVENPTYFDMWSPIHETDVAVSYIENREHERDAEKPFALFVAYNPPHMPFDQVPETYRELYSGADPRDLLVRPNLNDEGYDLASPHVLDYFAMISGVDDQFGRILKAVDDSDIADSTVVVFTSDHGEMMGSHGRMHKDLWFEESLRVPFLLRFPDLTGAGSANQTLFGVPDLHATLLSLLGTRADETCQGADLSNAFTGQTGTTLQSVPYMCMGTRDRIGVRSERYTYAVDRDGGTLASYLYDNQEDPYQMVNLAGRSDGLESEQKSLLRNHLVATGNLWPEL